jgi:hypothetical protein
MKKRKEIKDKPTTEPGFALEKENYRLMAIGFGIIVLGFILMIGAEVMIPMFSIRIFSVSGASPLPL